MKTYKNAKELMKKIDANLNKTEAVTLVLTKGFEENGLHLIIYPNEITALSTRIDMECMSDTSGILTQSTVLTLEYGGNEIARNKLARLINLAVDTWR